MEEALGADTTREDILWDKVLTLIADNATAKPASDPTDAAAPADTAGDETPTEATEEEGAEENNWLKSSDK